MGYEKKINSLLWKGVENGVFPGAVLLVSMKNDIIYYGSAGYLSITADRKPMKHGTIFDLASLTKPLVTTLCMMKLVDEGIIELDTPLSSLPMGDIPQDKASITPRMLLNHCSGLTDWEPFYKELINKPLPERKKYVRELIIQSELKYRPLERTLYSDLGFIILEWIIESLTGASMKDFFIENFLNPLGLERVFLYDGELPQSVSGDMIAPTEYCHWRNRLIHGEVHDENAYALGGYSGHAGLFGDAMGVYRICSMLLDHYTGRRKDLLAPDIVRGFFKKQDIVNDSTWALGWDTPSDTGSSSGRYFSKNSVGHLGFTGVSVWMDLESLIISILLTNRVHPSRENNKIKEFRPLLHNTIQMRLM